MKGSILLLVPLCCVALPALAEPQCAPKTTRGTPASAGMPPLCKRLIVCQLSEAGPLRRGNTDCRNRRRVTAKVPGQRVPHFIEMHQFVSWIVDCCGVASND